MDKLKGLLNKAGSSSGGDKPADPNQQGGAGGQEDYIDKGLDSFEKKQGINLSRDQNEKITDGARDFFEKGTGKKIPEKFSN